MTMSKNLGKVEANSLEINLKSILSPVLMKAGKATEKAIKSSAPVRSHGKSAGAYAQGWTSQLTDNGETVTIYNDGKHKSLSHLLENGHRAKDGSFVPPQEHIRPAYNQVKKQFMRDLKEATLQEIHHATGSAKKSK